MKEIFFFILVSIFIFLVDLYAFQAIKTVFPMNNIGYKIASIVFWSFTAYLFVAILSTAILGLENIPSKLRKLTAAIFFFGFLIKLFAIFWLFGEDIYRSIAFIFQKVLGNKENVSLENRRKFISQIAIFSAFVPLVVLTYGVLRNAYNYQFHKIKIASNKVPSKFKGFKIVQLSDIHSGSFNQTKPIEEVVEKINALNPDLILFTGDLVNDLATEMDDYKAIFANLKAKHGVYSVLGNHDYGDYAFGDKASAEKTANFERFLEVHKEMNWDLIRNDKRSIVIEDQSIDLIGVENTSANARFASHGDLSKAYAGLNKDSFKILMSHDPSHWDLEVNTKFQDIDLTLSGHTHGFQFGIETKYFKWSPSQYMYKQWAGLHQTGAQYLYVNRGFGNLGYPGRVGILPEVTVIELA